MVFSKRFAFGAPGSSPSGGAFFIASVVVSKAPGRRPAARQDARRGAPARCRRSTPRRVRRACGRFSQDYLLSWKVRARPESDRPGAGFGCVPRRDRGAHDGPGSLARHCLLSPGPSAWPAAAPPTHPGRPGGFRESGFAARALRFRMSRPCRNCTGAAGRKAKSRRSRCLRAAAYMILRRIRRKEGAA